MHTFRAYLLNAEGRIVWGEWIEAATKEDAIVQAHALCKEGAPMVELWLGDRPVAEIPCATRKPEASHPH